MKYSIIVFYFFALFGLISCFGDREKIQLPDSCYDNVQNQGETGVDCGGPCAACFTTPRCSIEDNSFFYGENQSMRFSPSCDYSSSSFYLESINPQNGYGRLRINFKKKPTKTYNYEIKAEGPIDENQVLVSFSESFDTYYATEGYVHIEVKNNVINATFCNIPFEYSSGYRIDRLTGSGNFTTSCTNY